jgi:hypothetical protein
LRNSALGCLPHGSPATTAGSTSARVYRAHRCGFSSGSRRRIFGELVPRTAFLADSQIFRRCFAAIFRLFIAHLGALIEGAQTGSFHGRDVHKNVFAALIGLNKSIALSGVKPLHNTRRHARSPFYANHPEPRSLGVERKKNLGGPRLGADPSRVS